MALRTVRTRVARGLKPRRAHPRSKTGAAGYLAILAFLPIYVVVDLYRPLPVWVAALYLGASVVCFVAYAVDKSAARGGRWRVSERTLLLLGFVGGWPGAILAQQLLRHKTRKASFRAAFWTSTVVNVAAFVTLGPPLLQVLAGTERL
jgi:uncharacterized membrane protein YsdA (DUF1294 family)